MKSLIPYCYIGLVCLLTACGTPNEIVAGCQAKGSLQPICGLEAPEDLALTPDGQHLIISQMGGMDTLAPGSLALLNLSQESARVVFDGSNELPQSSEWGAENCPGIPDQQFSPHGLDLVQRSDGRWQLFVVNHGGRESIELFELKPQIAGQNNSYQLQWQGCVIAPNDEFFNDVAGLKSGGFVTSKMFNKHDPKILGFSTGLWQALVGVDTGAVLEWQPNQGFHVVPGSEAPFINGLELSADEKHIFTNLYIKGEVRKIDRTSGELLGVADIAQPDNSTWDRRGYLIVASHTDSMMDMGACMDMPRETVCPAGFEIVALDPETMDQKVLLQHKGAPMGAATVALQVENLLYIGSFQGDRLLKTPYPQ